MKFKISEIAQVVGGGTPSTKEEDNYAKSGVAWITPKDLSGYTKKYIANGSRDISEKGLNSSGAKLMPKGTVLVSSRAPIGYVAIADGPLATNQGFKSLVPNEDVVTSEYLYYMMKQSKLALEQVATGTTFKEVSGSVMKNFEIDIPNLDEQERVVSILAPIDQKIELLQTINDNLANLISTAFENTYERASAESTLGEVSEVTNGYAFKSKDLVSVPSDTTKAVFKMGNIQAGGGISHPSTKSWVEPPYFPKEKFLAREGDILMSMTDMKDNVRILGHTALMDRDKQYYVNQRVGILRATRLPAEYLYPLTNSKNFIQNLRMKANRGVQVNLTTKAIKESIVKVPDAKSLDDYLAIVNPLFDLQKLNSLEIDNLVEIRNEILNRMVH